MAPTIVKGTVFARKSGYMTAFKAQVSLIHIFGVFSAKIYFYCYFTW